MSGDDVVRERLRDAYGAQEEDSRPGPDCADPARIWAAVRGELPRAQARALLDHALDCPACGAAWRLARDVSAEAPGGVEPSAARPRFGRWIAAAAAVIVVALVPVGLHLWRAPETPLYRDENRVVIRSLVREGSSLPRGAFVLRWTPGPEGTRYSFHAVRADLSVVASATALDRPEYLVSPERLGALPSGLVLYWRVEAHLPDGKQLVSETFSARLE